MIVVFTRAKKDAKALKHALKTEVQSLKGVRHLDSFDLKAIENKIPFFILGKEDESLREDLLKALSEFKGLFKILIVNKRSVRNARLSELISAFEQAKAELRLGLTFKNDTYLFSGTPGLFKEVKPDYDAYFLLGEDFVKNTKEVFGVELKEGVVLLRKHYNLEEVYVPELKAILSKKLGESPKVTWLNENISCKNISLSKVLEKNKEVVRFFERVGIEFLKESLRGKRDVVVPFSGGKDSTAVLALCVRAGLKVRAVYVKTNYELPFTEEYVERICNSLGVDLQKVEVNLDVNTHGMPSFENRWCTAQKLEALKLAAGNSVLIAGDREAESRSRRKRKEVTKRVSKELYPIKYWSAFLVQLYLICHDIPLHPLYYHGFYRLGCSICPSMGDWERYLLKKVEKIF